MKPDNLFRAEWYKMTRNFKPFSFLVLIYPVAAATVFGLILVALVAEGMRTSIAGSAAMWPDQFLVTWQALNTFPQSIFLRLPFLAFVAVTFAGEYQWQTWKNIVPRNRRTALVLAKFAALAVLLLLVGLATSFIWGTGRGILALIVGGDYSPALTGDLLRTFARDYLLEIGVALTGMVILAGYAALAALRARSILAGVFLSLGLAIVEPISLILLLMFGRLIERPGLIKLFRVTPTYNLENVRSWVLEGEAVQMIPDAFMGPDAPAVADPLLFSVALLLLWVAGLVLATVWVFRRQDLDS